MASLLKELSLAIGLLSTNPSASGYAMGLRGYVWQIADMISCQVQSRTACLLISSRWDWKRPQFYSIYRNNTIGNKINFQVELNNRDAHDTDVVCVFVILSDYQHRILSSHFSTVKILPRSRKTFDFDLYSAKGDILRIEIGTKQCDENTAAEIATARRIEASIAQGKNSKKH